MAITKSDLLLRINSATSSILVSEAHSLHTHIAITFAQTRGVASHYSQLALQAVYFLCQG